MVLCVVVNHLVIDHLVDALHVLVGRLAGARLAGGGGEAAEAPAARPGPGRQGRSGSGGGWMVVLVASSFGCNCFVTRGGIYSKI